MPRPHRLLTSRAALWVIAGSLAGRALVGVLVGILCLLPWSGPRRAALCSDVAGDVLAAEVKFLEVVKSLAIHCGLVPAP